MLREQPILIGAAIPPATLLLCWIAGTGLSAAVIAAVWTSAGIVVSIEPDRAAASGPAAALPSFRRRVPGIVDHPPQGHAPEPRVPELGPGNDVACRGSTAT
jgi:hypothetical protein